jgi:hypothetical protein
MAFIDLGDQFIALQRGRWQRTAVGPDCGYAIWLECTSELLGSWCVHFHTYNLLRSLESFADLGLFCRITAVDCYPLRGFKPTRYSVHVNGPWCITFEFEDGDASRIAFEQCH